MTSSNSEQSYFDLHTKGLGYINRIREVRPPKGIPFLACTVAALMGPCDAAEYRYFDVIVVGTDAKRLIREYRDAVDNGRKVLVGFVLGDLWIDQFTYSSGVNAGKPGACLKARLLSISWMRVDGQQVYKAEGKSVVENGSGNTVAATPDEKAAARELSEIDDEPHSKARLRAALS